jgi:uncharacterized repeat protein (TIGR01451 family)
VLRDHLLSLPMVSLLGIFLVAGCGGTGSSSSSTQPPSTANATNPTPAITSIAPVSVIAGSASQTLTVTGTGFVSSSVVKFNSTALATTYVNATSITAVVPASAISADGSAQITVSNPAPGGGSSAIKSYTITVPTPAVTGLSPQTVPQAVAATVAVSGTGFEANSIVQWNGSARPTTYVNPTTLQVALTAADVQNFGTGQVTVVNPGDTPTTPLDLLIIASTPTITSLSPSSIAAITGSSVPQQIVIGGSGFAANATVQSNGQPVPALSQTVTTITISLSASYFETAGVIKIVVSNPGTPVVSSNQATLTVTSPATASFTVNPNYAPAGSPDTTITLNGNGFYQDSVVYWNKTALSTSFISSNSVTAVIPSSLLTSFAQANISVSTPENSVQAATQPFDTFLALPTNDIIYNAAEGSIYASVPGFAGKNFGNSIVAIDPTTGVIRKVIFVGSEPNRLALSTDGTQIFVGLNGAGAVRQVDLTTGKAGVQFLLGGGPGVYNPPYTAVSLAALPGQPNSVAVYGTNGVVTIFDSGVARAKTSSGLQTYFVQNIGSLAFGGSASTLYVTSEAIGSYLYKLTIDATGVTSATQVGMGNSSGGGNTMQYDNGLLYFPTGVAVNATTGAQAGQFSGTSIGSNSPVAVFGPIVSDSSLNRAWIVPYSNVNSGGLTSFDEKTYDPVASLPITGSELNNAADLIRWGQNGLAFHTSSQLYVLQGPIVKDISSSPADVSVAVNVAPQALTGSSLTYTVQVLNQGPNVAQGVTLTSMLPESVVQGSVQNSQGSCTGTGELYCDLGSIASGSSATITIATTPTVAGALQLIAITSSVSYDPVSSNNQATAKTTITGNPFSAPPLVTQLSPTMVQAGSDTWTLTVNGSGFSSASTVLWNGTELPTTLVSSGQLTATVDAFLVKQLGWSLVSVSTAAPGGGRSAALPLSIYQLLNVPANAMKYDPFTRKLYAVLPSTSASLTGNSIVAIDPATGSVGTPISVGSEPNLLSETSDGKYMYVGLSGAKALGRFNLMNQSLDLTVPLPANATYQGGSAAAIAIATVPGSDTSLALEDDSFDGIGILDISGSVGTFRPKSGFGYSGDNPVFVDPTHFYAYDAYTSGAEFYRYSVDTNGAELIDGTTLDGMGGFGGIFAVDGGFVYGAAGGIINPSTTPPTQVAVLPLGPGPYGAGLIGGGVVPYAAESKSFNIGVNAAGTALTFLNRFDTRHFTLEDQLQFPTSSVAGVAGTRWAQDGLAFIIPGPSSPTQTTPTSQIFLIRGAFVLPAEVGSNAAPTLSSTDQSTITAGSGNLTITVTGSGFLPGATVLWNGSPRTTTYVDSSHVTVAVPASDVKVAAADSLSCQNPGSGVSNTITATVQ